MTGATVLAADLLTTWWELWLVVVVGLLAAALAPAVIAATSATRRPTPTERDHLTAAGVPPERVRVVAAGDAAAAFAAGFSPRFGRVFLTTGLCETLAPESVAAVARHEYGHLRRRHVPLRLAVPVAFAVAWVAAARLAPGTGFLVGIALLVPTVAVSVALARWTERDADRFAARVTGGERLAAALATLSADGHLADGGRFSWHPALADRIARLDADADGRHEFESRHTSDD